MWGQGSPLRSDRPLKLVSHQVFFHIVITRYSIIFIFLFYNVICIILIY